MKTGKNLKIAATRPSLIGDTVSFLPVLNYFDLLYPDSYKYFFIAKKCAQSAFLYFNHEKIDNIRILELPEALGPKDLEIFNSCDIKTNPFPQHKGMPGIDCFWWNERPMAVETWTMAGLLEEDYYKLPKELQFPKLDVWFKYDEFPKTIAIWAYAGYGKEPNRSPNKAYWEKIIERFIKEGYSVIRLGHSNEPWFFESGFFSEGVYKYQDWRGLSFFEQVKISCGCLTSICSNSGIAWIIGAYGFPQITLLTNDAPNHVTLLDSFAPLNYKGNNINLTSLDGFDTLPHEEVLAAIEKLK